MKYKTLMSSLSLALAWSCADDKKVNKLTAEGKLPTTAAQEVVKSATQESSIPTKVDTPKTETESIIQENIQVVGADQQVKNAVLIRQSLNTCMGDKFILTSKDMYVLTPTPAPAGKRAFLMGTPVDGEDIIQKEESSLYEGTVPIRGQVATYPLSLSYLGALGTVANVVAHNCNFTSETSPCLCKTEQNAHDLLKRCLPGHNDALLIEASKRMTALCRTGKDAPEQELNSRKAIAAVLGSGAFALAR